MKKVKKESCHFCELGLLSSLLRTGSEKVLIFGPNLHVIALIKIIVSLSCLKESVYQWVS